MTLEELKAKATELKIEFDDSITEGDLSTKVAEAEEAAKSDPEYLKSEAKKAFDARDKAKKANLSAQAELKKLKDQMSNTVNKEEYDSLTKELKELRQRQLEFEEEEEKKKFEKASSEEKLKMANEKREKELEKSFQMQLEAIQNSIKSKDDEIKKQKDVNKILLSKSLESEILVAAEKNKALRPSQIVKLLKEDFEWDETLNKYIHNEFDAKGKLVDYHEVETYVADFLTKEENDNLVKSDVTTTSTAHKRGENTTTINTKDKNYKPTGTYDPKNPELLFEARKEGIAVEELIKRKELKDKILAERAEKLKK